jgi:flagellar motor switch protein FliN
LRVWAELGRTQLPLGRALRLPLGAVLELDRTADAPIDLYVNGTQFARGRLLVTDDGEWAFALDEVGDRELLERSAVAARISASSTQGA